MSRKLNKNHQTLKSHLAERLCSAKSTETSKKEKMMMIISYLIRNNLALNASKIGSLTQHNKSWTFKVRKYADSANLNNYIDSLKEQCLDNLSK